METYLTIIGAIVVACTSALVIGIAFRYFLEWGLLKIIQQIKVYHIMIEYAHYRKRFRAWAKENNIESFTKKFESGLNEKIEK